MFFSSGHDDGCLLDDVAHETARIPIGRVGLRLAAAAGAPDHQCTRSLGWRGEADLPLAEGVLAFVLAELCLLPGVTAIAGGSTRDTPVSPPNAMPRANDGAPACMSIGVQNSYDRLQAHSRAALNPRQIVRTMYRQSWGGGQGAGAITTVEQFLMRGLATACQACVVGAASV
jgi:hypothetical protein